MSWVIMPNHIHGILTINPIAETKNVVAYYDETQRISDVVETQNVAIHDKTQRISDGVETHNYASLQNAWHQIFP